MKQKTRTKENVKVKRSATSKGVVARWKKLKEQGLSYAKIAEKYNVSRQCVHQALEKVKLAEGIKQWPKTKIEPRYQYKPGIEKLISFIESVGKTKSEFGRQIGYKHDSAIFRILNGDHKPSPQIAMKIVRETKGAVTLEDLLL